MKKIVMLLMTMTLAIVTVACSNNDTAEEENTEEPASEETEADNEDAEEETAPAEETQGGEAVSEDELAEEDQTVATVNGEEILGAQYNSIYPQLKNMIQQTGQDVSDTEAIKEQVLNELITQELILQDARDEGLEVDSEEVENQINGLKDQYGDEYAAALESQGLTEEEYKSQMEKSLLRDQYMETVIGIKVTEEEVEDYYNQMKEQTEEEVPPLEEVEAQVKQQLTTQKQQEKQEEIMAKFEELRENAEIEQLI
ncbi:hypothetical protein JCM21714_2384 [Gracilibacillus boraciitolerans JCM 21714]|uniref:peptidylprolyl isomerase n=1 Tax=Gracilibacillus boraciitolerans JCM 21714 TaxID=1298598 RepID=W4VJB7_9BACI|nr:SurA N-terminal domain-containing protein [Gracilibacillus boraciitolerans]GAE93312.1 hypothetical protein JCM21714_2384 [Gracilibacillus boraciitolerans JCM 21714]